MDNHPIPQDVTNFQFRLIGDMTIKQFGYIVAGVILAWAMLASPLFFLLRLLLAGSSVLTAVILAFAPIEGRPADVMLLHFLKALFSPTQFVYQKPIQQSTQTAVAPQTVVPQAPVQKQEKEDEKKEEKVQVESFIPVATAAVAAKIEEAKEEKHDTQPETKTPNAQIIATSTPSQQQDQLLQKEVADLSAQLQEAKTEEGKQQGSSGEAAAHTKVTTLEKELQDIMKQKQLLEEQLVALQKSLSAKKQQVFTPSESPQQSQPTQHVKKLAGKAGIAEGAPLMPDVPNLIAGIVKDPRGNVLSNILIEVKDKDGNPVRAFKTNQLGQFAAATPLVNGTYTISFEDPTGKQSFDSVEITANGEILPPLGVISIDAREKLRQELFGVPT